MVISKISIPTAAILDAILNSAKCSRVPGRHHSDSGYVAQGDLETLEKHLTYQSARFIIECIKGHPTFHRFRCEIGPTKMHFLGILYFGPQGVLRSEILIRARD